MDQSRLPFAAAAVDAVQRCGYISRYPSRFDRRDSLGMTINESPKRFTGDELHDNDHGCTFRPIDPSRSARPKLSKKGHER